MTNSEVFSEETMYKMCPSSYYSSYRVKS